MTDPEQTGSGRTQSLAEVISATKWEHDDHTFEYRGEPSLDNYADLDDRLRADGGTDSTDIEQNFQGYSAVYCENCGRLVKASEEIRDAVEEPVHRVEIIEAIGPIEEVGETVATEEDECECTGQLVKRYYAYPASEVPQDDYEPDPEEFTGRDPEEDGLVALATDPDPEDWQERREVPGLEGGESDAE